MFCRGKCSLMLFDVWLAGRYAISCSWMSGSHMSDSCKADTIHVQKKMMVLVLAHCYGTGNGSFMKKWYNLIGIFVLRFFVFVESNYTLDKCIFRCQIWVKLIYIFLFIPYNYLSERLSKKLSNLLMLWACICNSVFFQKSKKGLGCGSLTQILIYLK